MYIKKKDFQNRIVITGGHAATTAIAVVKEIQKRHSDWNLYWIGPKSAVEGKFVPTLASSVMPQLNVKFISITSGRLQRKFTSHTIPSLLKIPVGFFQAFKILLELKPKIIISFGGYSSVPVCFAGWLLRIPVFIHEQTIAIGTANKINSFFAKKILISREDSLKYFPKSKTILTGNPVSPDIISLTKKSKPSKPMTVYITGGSSGAQRINNVVADSLYELLKNYKVIHQTGMLDFNKFTSLKENFTTDLKKKYEVYDFINPNDISGIFKKADIIISRGGANTISEILVSGIPSIIIPIPWTAYNEQTKNARSLESTGLGIVLEEKDLSSETLLDKIELVSNNWKKMAANFDPSLANLDKFASQKFVDELERSM